MSQKRPQRDSGKLSPDQGQASRNSSLPEERSLGKMAHPSSSSRQPVLFGDEGEETGPPGQGDAESEASSNDEGALPVSQTLNVSWSGLDLFRQATFMKHVAEDSKPQKKKRPYDNSKRAENAAAKVVNSNKDHGLDSSRLGALQKKPQCQCFLAALPSTSDCLHICVFWRDCLHIISVIGLGLCEVASKRASNFALGKSASSFWNPFGTCQNVSKTHLLLGLALRSFYA